MMPSAAAACARLNILQKASKPATQKIRPTKPTNETKGATPTPTHPRPHPPTHVRTSRTGPFTFRRMERLGSSRNSTRTYILVG